MNSLKRSNGLILPIFSIPGPYGIGSFGKEAFKIVDFLEEAGFSYRQILPIGPTSFGDSPYQSFSSFAGNPYFVDLDILADEELISKDDLKDFEVSDIKSIDYGYLYKTRFKILKKAYENSFGKFDKEIEIFRRNEGYWLEDYALYMAIKKNQGDKSWLEFEEGLKCRDEECLRKFREAHKELIDLFVFIQFEFFKQWKDLKSYANSKNIRIIGDLSFYLALDSADTWANTEILKIDQERKELEKLAGVPPDMFSDDGQLWGNPVYNWEKLRIDNFDFLLKRFGHSLKLYDVLRLDHFRAFESYYEIEKYETTAKNGQWIKSKGKEFFDILFDRYPDAVFIAEDLGYITYEVKKLKDDFDIYGTKVIQFAFDGNPENPYLPHFYKRKSVVYSSTHDSDTLQGYLDNVNWKNREYLEDYFDIKKDENERIRIIKGLMASVSDLSVFEIQDFLGYGNEARINFPGTIGKNRTFRLTGNELTDDLAKKINHISKLYGRL